MGNVREERCAGASRSYVLLDDFDYEVGRCVDNKSSTG